MLANAAAAAILAYILHPAMHAKAAAIAILACTLPPSMLANGSAPAMLALFLYIDTFFWVGISEA